MKKTLLLVTSLLFGAALVGCQTSQTTEMESAEASMKTITGTVAYRERIALPPHAVVTVALEDVSLADAPAKVLAKQTFETEGKQVPLAFELSYNSNDIKPNHRYSLRARIEVDGKLRFINDTSIPVITDTEQTHQANIRLVGTR
ncbi:MULTISPECIES: YbaY family lipoprotein [Vibrio]|uniref:YbaY family lipoprotein n=1 Tax=Vibrio TaxID=662 RepID=UPI000399958C|nr:MULTISPECIES: YbaY family lipoprotein [Vibrio]AIV04998.1 lipo-like protein [Vibrio harveyi]EKO3805977.1 YbaY family lipoprotein [Vibrio harveyi]EKO3823827.1 YbaY family lipoprotein [Vibrio harveyi]EKO3864444.1 YbaY family lipoprotein [Vibrio harveyi]EKO3870709.1 YbaY family lipoprotein [Vibrio harveyi]